MMPRARGRVLTLSRRSTSRVSTPSLESWIEVVSPTGPAPQMITGTSRNSLSLRDACCIPRGAGSAGAEHRVSGGVRHRQHLDPRRGGAEMHDDLLDVNGPGEAGQEVIVVAERDQIGPDQPGLSRQEVQHCALPGFAVTVRTPAGGEDSQFGPTFQARQQSGPAASAVLEQNRPVVVLDEILQCPPAA